MILDNEQQRDAILTAFDNVNVKGIGNMEILINIIHAVKEAKIADPLESKESEEE